MSSRGWINNIAKIFNKKGDRNSVFLTIPLAEEVNIVLQRRNKEGKFFTEEALLVPQEDTKGFKSVKLVMKKATPYEFNGETITPSENLRYTLDLPPAGS
jgi:hypothetical protein